MSAPNVDFGQMAARAQASHARALEAYWRASGEVSVDAYREVIFKAAERGVRTLVLEPSDQGNWCIVTAARADDGSDLFDEVQDYLDAVSDVPDDRRWWESRAGVTMNYFHKEMSSVEISVSAAAGALLEGWGIDA